MLYLCVAKEKTGMSYFSNMLCPFGSQFLVCAYSPRAPPTYLLGIARIPCERNFHGMGMLKRYVGEFQDLFVRPVQLVSSETKGQPLIQLFPDGKPPYPA